VVVVVVSGGYKCGWVLWVMHWLGSGVVCGGVDTT